MTKLSVSQSKAKKNRVKPEPVYIPVSDIELQDKVTVLRTRYFYLIAEAEAVSREIDRLGGESCKK